MKEAMRGDIAPKIVISSIASIGVAIMLFIIGFLIKESLPILSEVSLGDILGGDRWYPTFEPPFFGMFPLIAGSISVTFLSSILSIPFSIGLAVFISEVCPGSLKEYFKPVLEMLGFLPSVVLGFIGMIILAPALQRNLDLLSGLNMFNASILMGILMIPTVASIAEDSLNAVPPDLRYAAYGLGSTRFETITRVIIPSALPGIIQASLLGVMRAVGETMVVLMAAGGAAMIPESIMDPVRPLTSTIAAEMGETPVGSLHYNALFFAGLVLLVMTLVINMTAAWIDRYGKRWRT